MAIKDVLLELTTYPEPTPVSAVAKAVILAETLGARISAIACEARVPTPGRVNLFADMLIDIPAMVAQELRMSSVNAQKLLTAFEREAQKRGIFQEKILEKCLTSEVPSRFVEYARLRDLTIVPLPQGDYVDKWYAESIVFESGRPVMLMPHEPKRIKDLTLNSVAVAWDFSRPAARAVADAIPLLERAKEVRIVTVINEKVIDSSRSAPELAKYLLRHGISAIVEEVDAAGRKIGDCLETYTIAHDIDLLVMGAFGHSRFREFMLGGATQRMLSNPPLPILMSH